MVARVLLDTNGLAISKPGTSVLTAARKDLAFSSGSASFPIIETILYLLPGNWGNENFCYFAQTYPNRPMISLYWWGATDPTTLGLSSQYPVGLIPICQSVYTGFQTHYVAGSGHYCTTYVKLYADKFSIMNKKNVESASDLTPFSGYITAKVFGFFD